VIGETHGHYRITERIGAGGMGEVYRATDTKLKRDVAIKVLPDELAQDPARLARFQREAELLASLNHSNIAAIHGLEEAAGKPLLVLELVEGEDLSERLKRGKVPLAEALELCAQITDALQAAHEKGIVHRDLKPANVMVTPEGQVKVLDFGLAKAWAGEAGAGRSSADLSQSPTLAHTGTAAGLILGTAAYMSPEQASGKAVDKRTDIWAFGVVLFEMLTGDRLFSGENVSEILASVIKEEPGWEHLPEDTPRSATRLLRRCLRKKARERLQDIGDARLEIEEARQELASGPGDSESSDAETRASGPDRLAWGLAAVLAVATAGLAVRSLLPGPTRGPLQLSIPLAPARHVGAFAISPDGSRVAFPSRDEDGVRWLYVRALDEPAARRVPGTETAAFPFFSPDGEWIAFYSHNPAEALLKVPVNGGPVVTLAEGNFRGSRGTWTVDGWIVTTQPSTGDLLRVRVAGGPLETLKASEADAQEVPRTVSKISGSRALLLTVSPEGTRSPDAAVAIQSLETGERRILAPGGARPRHLASGHIVYSHSGRLIASKLDVAGMQLLGTPVPLDAVIGDQDVGYFDVSPDGDLVFVSSPDVDQPARMAWIDRNGRATPLSSDVAGFDLRLSPDGTRVTMLRQGDMWVLDLDRGTTTRISSAAGEDETGTWSPDGRWIAWAAHRPGEKRALLRRRSDGSGPEERLWSDERHFHVASWSPAGIVVTVSDPTTGWDVLLLDPEDDSEARPLLNGTFSEKSARVSPDGRLVAFVSDETGRDEVYVQAFPKPGAKVQVSVGGGEQPVWRPETREIVYRGSGQIMSVILGPGDPPSVPASLALFDDRLRPLSGDDHTDFAVHRDGRLLTSDDSEQSPRRHIRIVLDWMEAAGLGP